MLCPERQCCDGGRADYALLMVLAKCNDDHIAVNAVMKDRPSNIIQRCNYNHVRQAHIQGYSTCVQRCLQLVHQIMEAQHEGIQKQGYSQFTYKVYMQTPLTNRTEHAKRDKSVLDMSPFKIATGTGNVAKMHVLH